jgi:hypothetical protein
MTSESCRPEALDALLLAAFRQACLEGEQGAAEHIFRALEELAADGRNSTNASACLDEACLTLAGEVPGARGPAPPTGRRTRRTH